MGGAIGLGIGIPFAEVVGAGGADCPILEALHWDEVGYVNGSSTIDVEINGQVVDDKGFTIDGTNGTYCQFAFGTSPNLASNPQVPFSYPVINNTPQSTIFTGLTPGTTYYYGIIAYNGKCVAQTAAVQLVTPELDMIVTFDTTLTQGLPSPINAPNVIRLPFAPITYTETPNFNLDITVNWGDGTTDVYNTNPVNFPADVPMHVYATPGTYDVIITPNGRGIEGWSFTANQTNAKTIGSTKLIEIKQWGDMVFGVPSGSPNAGFNATRYWYECINLGPINAPDTPMIVGNIVRSPQINWGFSRSFNLGLPKDQNIARLNDWDLRTLVRFEGLFRFCDTFNGNVENWYTPNMERMTAMFDDTDFQGDVSKWNTDNLGMMFTLFSGCTNFNSDCSTKTVTRKAVYNSGRSGNYKEFTDTAWNMDNAFNLASLFDGCTSFDNGGNPQGLNGWGIGNATPFPGELYNLSNVFRQTQFNGDLNNWDVSQCKNFSFLFEGNTVFNGDITNWDFSGLAVGSCNSSQMIFMLRGATSFNQDISNWDLTGVGGMNGLMGPNFPPHPLPSDPTLDTSIYNDVLVNFSALGNYSRAANCSFWSSGGTNYFNFGNSQFDPNLTNVVSARNQLILDLGAIIDGGPVPGTPLTDATFQTAINDILAQDPNGDFNLVPYGKIQNWDTSQVTTMEDAFQLRNTFNGDISNWDTSSVTNMANMFDSCSIFNQDIGNWDVSNVDNFFSLFEFAIAFNQDISGWDTSSAIKMGRMFYKATAFNQNLNNWDTSNVDTMYRMFREATSFNQPLNNWNTGNVLNMAEMFYDMGFNQSIDAWDVSSLEDAFGMFEDNTAFNQNLNSWNTASLEGISDMFNGATAFNGQIDNWDVSNVTQFQRMFQGASSFNQPLNSWNTSTGNQFQEMFDGATVFNQNLNNWDVSNGTIARMFRDATAFNGDISTWSVGHVSQFHRMFENATNFDIDISGWDTSSGFNMINMFKGASSFNQDLSSWNVTGVQFCTGVFDNTPSWTDPKPNFTNCTP
tara:strand:+ start:22016 stop:25087 length:3072 start_codon:yes stop_codon:yes gene_type:complete